MLSIKNLSNRLLADVNIDVNAGQCVCIHGESGSGKTLLLRAIADLDENSGEVELDGLSRNTTPANIWRQQVMYLPAESHWWLEDAGSHFISDNVDFTALALPDEITSWSVSRLSTGEKQRLSLLRALDYQPKVLLMDETTANLDDENTHRVEALIRNKLNQGLTVIWVSHSAAQRQRMADSSWQISAGHLQQDH